MSKRFTLHNGDCLEVMKSMEANSVDSIVSDPPYGISFMGKNWDTGVPGKVFWEEALRVAKPGAYLLAFGGTRTFHRLTCAIEDAGWEIRDCASWLYGTGFPKSLDISKAVDKKLGAEREIIGQRISAFGDTEESESEDGRNLWGKPSSTSIDITGAAVTDEAKKLGGMGTALKPAWEPIIMARKPVTEKTVVDNILKYGTGCLNIDGCRIPITDGALMARNNNVSSTFCANAGKNKAALYGEPCGRFPTNLILSHSPECVENKCVDDCPLKIIDEQSGLTAEGNSGSLPKPKGTGGLWSGKSNAPCGPTYSDGGGASRFFYCAKASREDRNEGLEGFEEKRPDERTETGMGTFAKKGVAKQANFHPTVKPTNLMRYLARLVTPVGGVVLDPFMGSGSTGKAAILEGFNFVGIDITPEYVKIAEARISSALEQTNGELQNAGAIKEIVNGEEKTIEVKQDYFDFGN